jgi:hypothetical protein
MQETFLLKIALGISILGIISLFLLSNFIDNTNTSIEKITGESDGTTLTGIIKNIKNSGGKTFITLTREVESTILIMDNTSTLKSGDKVKILGRPLEDQQTSQNNQNSANGLVIAEKIILLP